MHQPVQRRFNCFDRNAWLSYNSDIVLIAPKTTDGGRHYPVEPAPVEVRKAIWRFGSGEQDPLSFRAVREL